MYLIKTFENFDYGDTRDQMISHLCNCGYNKQDLENLTDKELAKICRETPKEVSEKKKFRK